MTTDTSTSDRTGGLQETAKGLAAEVGDSAEQQAGSLMANAGSTVHRVASAVRSMGDELRAEQPQVARFSTMAADRMEDAASYLDDHDPRELVDEAQRFARQQPFLIVAGGLAVGLALGRLLRTASSPNGGGSGTDWYNQGYRSSGSEYGSGSQFASGSQYGGTVSGSTRAGNGRRTTTATPTSLGSGTGSGTSGSLGADTDL